MNKLAQLAQKAKNLKAEMQKEGKAALSEALSEFFAANPRIAALLWTQYAPHFNDGEPCNFYLHDVFAIPFGSEGDLPPEADKHAIQKVAECTSVYEQETELTKSEQTAVYALQRALTAIEDELADILTEDGKVICYRDGTIEISEVDHS